MISEKKRILIIDDDEDILETLHSLLIRKGYAVENANSGMAAVEKSNSSFFNLALIDIVLPDMEGTQLLVKLKPSSAKGTYLKSITISTTLGPGIKIDPTPLQTALTAK